MGFSKDISSSANAQYKIFASLHTSKGINKNGLALISGLRFIKEIIRDHSTLVEAWIVSEKHSDSLITDSFECYRLTSTLFKELDLFGTNEPLLLIKTPPLTQYDPNRWPKGCSLVVPFQNPENCGGVIRSAAAFGVSRVILTQEAAHPFLPKSTRAAGPALFNLTLVRAPSLAEIDFGGIPYFALSAEGRPISEASFPDTFALVPGIEGPGIPESLRRSCWSIPMEEGVESLNAATATAVALYEWRRHR